MIQLLSINRTKNCTLSERMPTGGQPVFANGESFESNSFLEVSVVVETDHIKLYFTSNTSDTANTIALATAPTIAGPFTIVGRVIGRGTGGAPSGRNAHSSCILKKDGVYHCWALNGYGFAGEPRDVWHYTSSDGITWTSDAAAALTTGMYPDVQGYGNLCVWPELVNGKYYMSAEYDSVAENIWKVVIAETTSLSGPWTITHTVSGLQAAAGGMYGGCDLKHIGGQWHVWYHYGSGEAPLLGGNLPTYLAYATSSDLQNWVLREAPFKKILISPHGPMSYSNHTIGTNQIADPWLFEQNGKTYLVAEYVRNTSPIQSVLYYWEYEGNITNLVNGLGYRK